MFWGGVFFGGGGVKKKKKKDMVGIGGGKGCHDYYNHVATKTCITAKPTDKNEYYSVCT